MATLTGISVSGRENCGLCNETLNGSRLASIYYSVTHPLADYSLGACNSSTSVF